MNILDFENITPLIALCSTGYEENSDVFFRIVRELLKHEEVDVNIQDNEGRSPLIAACSSKCLDESETNTHNCLLGTLPSGRSQFYP